MSAEEAYKDAQAKIAVAAAENAAKLNLNFDDLDRIPPEIAQLKDLTTLNLWGTQVADIAPLAQLTGLTTLDLTGTQVADIAPLAQLTGLTRLYLYGTQVADIAPLAQLNRLTTLDLRDTKVTDIAPLAQLNRLTTLDLRRTRVADLAALAQLTGLTTLSLEGTKVSDITPLAQLTRLTTLYLEGTKVSDIAPLAQLTGLTALYLRATQVADIAPLAQLTRLTMLDLARTQVADIAPLANLTALLSLWVEGTDISDLSPVLALPDLAMLRFQNSQVSDLRPLLQSSFCWDLAGQKLPNGFRGELDFADCQACREDPQLAALGDIEDFKERAEKTRAYLRTLPPYPAPLPWKPHSSAPKVEAEAPSKTDTALQPIRFSDARRVLEDNYPLVRQRCQAVFAELNDAIAYHNLRIPNDPEGLEKHRQLADTLTFAKALIAGLNDALPEGFTDRPLEKTEIERVKDAFNQAIEQLQSAAKYIDNVDHSPSYAGLLKMGAATAVGTVLAVLPGINLTMAIPAAYGCLYGKDAAKSLAGFIKGSD